MSELQRFCLKRLIILRRARQISRDKARNLYLGIDKYLDDVAGNETLLFCLFGHFWRDYLSFEGLCSPVADAPDPMYREAI